MYLLSRGARSGTRSSSADVANACAVSRSSSSPMSTSSISPAKNAPGATRRPTFSRWKHTVQAASIATPATSPVDASTPEGMSIATTSTPVALTCSISRAAGGRGSPLKPVPKSASTISPGDPRSLASSSGRASTTRTSQSASRSTSALTRPSPPLLPGPHTTVIDSSVPYSSRTNSASDRPARSINSSTSCPASAARISSAV